MGSSGAEDSGMYEISAWEERGSFVVPMTVCSAGCESGIWTVVWLSGVGWYEEAIAASSAKACASTVFALLSLKMEARAV